MRSLTTRIMSVWSRDKGLDEVDELHSYSVIPIVLEIRTLLIGENCTVTRIPTKKSASSDRVYQLPVFINLKSTDNLGQLLVWRPGRDWFPPR